MIIDSNVIEYLIKFQVNFDYIEALFINRKTNIYGVYVVNKEIKQEGFPKYKKRRGTTII